MARKNLSATVDEDIAEKLETLSEETNRKKSYYVNQALREYFEALEDYETALSRRGGKTVPFKNAKTALVSCHASYVG